MPGRRGRVDGFMGKILSDLGYEVVGHNIDEYFQTMKFSQQVAVVKDDLEAFFFDHNARVIANSYGAYLFLHAVLEMEGFKGKSLLFSPMLGKSRVQENRPIVSPPRAKKLLQYKEENRFPIINIEVHTGLDDEICDPKLAKMIFKDMNSCKLVIVPNASHRLDGAYIKSVVLSFLER